MEIKEFFKDDCSRPDFTHKIHVRNSLSVEPDTKTFQIVYDLDKSLDVFNSMKNFLLSCIEKEKESLLFPEDKKTTHYITLKDIKGKTYSFHVEASFLSSCEIGEILEAYLCKGKIRKRVTMIIKLKKSDCVQSQQEEKECKKLLEV